LTFSFENGTIGPAMVISNIFLDKDSHFITLSADIAFRGKSVQRAYIKLDRKFESLFVNDASPFLAAVLLPCMKSKENIYVDGRVSAKFLHNTNSVMNLVTKWNIGMSKIKIRSKDVAPHVGSPKFVGEFFTAGVDSFYTYLKQKKTKDKITHLILVHGFDIPLDNKTFFAEVKKTVEKVAKEEKIQAVTLETNLGQIVEQRLVWDFSHGGALAAIALLLRGGLTKVFVSTAVRNNELFPYGTHPHLDKLWSSETLSIESIGGEYNRLEKIINVVGKSPLALKYLRVCTQNIKGKYNCSSCHKCLMTMMYLHYCGVLNKAKTFDNEIDLTRVRNMYYDYKLKYNTQAEAILKLFKKEKRDKDLQEAIIYSLTQSRKPHVMKRIYQMIAQWDQNHNDRRLYQFVFSMNNKEDRSALFKFLLNRGVLK
jgi:hypothetical protein